MQKSMKHASSKMIPELLRTPKVTMLCSNRVWAVASSQIFRKTALSSRCRDNRWRMTFLREVAWAIRSWRSCSRTSKRSCARPSGRRTPTRRSSRPRPKNRRLSRTPTLQKTTTPQSSATETCSTGSSASLPTTFSRVRGSSNRGTTTKISSPGAFRRYRRDSTYSVAIRIYWVLECSVVPRIRSNLFNL